MLVSALCVGILVLASDLLLNHRAEIGQSVSATRAVVDAVEGLRLVGVAVEALRKADV